MDFDTAGSITILAATTMPGDDVTHPVPDNTGYITEGQFYLRGGRIEPFGSLSRLKQQVNGKTRDDHRTIMNTDDRVQLYAAYRETLEKKAMGFRMSVWDDKLLRYGARFEKEMMDLSVNIPLEQALDLGWRILADCFEPVETGIPSRLVQAYWARAPTPDHGDIKHTKNELRAQRESLKRFERFLPMLQLKQKQLKAELRLVDAQVAEQEAALAAQLRQVGPWEGLFTGLENGPQLVDEAETVVETGNIAGVSIPILREVLDAAEGAGLV